MIAINFIYSNLLEMVFKNQNNIESIKKQYINLLSFLTKTEYMTTTNFVNKIGEISNIGDIIVCYIIENNDIVIVASGTIIIEPKIIHGGQSVGHIEDIVVTPQYRTNKIASTIINMLVQIAYSKNCYKVILDCKDDLVNVYEKVGFKQNGLQMSLYFE